MNTVSQLTVVLLYLYLGAISGKATMVDEICVVPHPDSIIEKTSEGWQLPKKCLTRIPGDRPQMRLHIDVLGEVLGPTMGMELLIAEKDQVPDISIRFDATLATEEYVVVISEQNAELVAGDLTRWAHATATMLQLIGQANDGQVPSMEITDRPDCAYRSVMLDLSRNPHGVACLKETMD